MNWGRVAVTGGSGRLGAYVVGALLGQCDLTVIDRVRPAGGAPYREADIRDLGAVRAALAGHDTVVHLAALDLVADAAPEEFTLTNVIGTWHVLQAAREAGAGRVVVCSSVAATGLDEGRADCPPLYVPVDEDHPRAPVHPYATSKLLVEEVAARFLRAGGMEVVCLRPVWVAFRDTLARLIARAESPDQGGVLRLRLARRYGRRLSPGGDGRGCGLRPLFHLRRRRGRGSADPGGAEPRPRPADRGA